MYRTSAHRLSAFLVAIVVCGVLSGAVALASASGTKSSGTPRLSHPLKHDRSQPLRDMRTTKGPTRPSQSAPRRERQFPTSGARSQDPVAQRAAGLSAPTPDLNFEGTTAADALDGFGFSVRPSDANGDVGSGHYVQLTTYLMQIWNTSGGEELGPLPTNTIFTDFGGNCGNVDMVSNQGLVRYDEQAARFVIAYLPTDFFGGIVGQSLCVAVSATEDPTGAYNRYEFGLDNIPDNLRLGVWSDGYYVNVNQFDPGSGSYAGILSVALDRSAMVDGEEAGMISFDLGGDFPNMFAMVPADIDGALPPEGMGNPQATPGQADWDGSPSPVLHMFEFHADFETPANSTLDGPFDVSVPDFNPVLCGFAFGCAPQLGDATLLDVHGGSPMHGMQYRNFGDHQSLVLSQTVNVSEDGDLAAPRWYEVRPATETAQGGIPPYSLFQSGTYTPTESNRFVPSITMDVSGNMAMGYTISDATIHPQIGVTGRLVGDPAGTMGAEAILFAGEGSETGAPFWGNITGIAVDPLDGCTFWYTNQYYMENVPFDWKSRIGTFRYASCTSGASGTISGTVTDGANPLEGATVTAGAASTSTDAAGHYELTLPVGTYDMTASKYGFLPGSADDVEVTEDSTTTMDFTLGPAPSQLVNGTVRDSLTNWPLYARIDVTGPGYPGAILWTDPVTGYYGLTLVEGITYTFTISAVSPGYETFRGELPLGVPFNAPLLVQNWTLTADQLECTAPGYTPTSGGMFEDFSGGSVPPGWTVTNESAGGEGGFPTEWVVVSGSDPCGNYTGNLTGGSGPFAVANSDCPGPTVEMFTQLITPPVNMSSFGTAVLRFKEDYRWLFDNTDVDISVNGGSSWTNVLAQTSDARGPRDIEIDITGLAAGQADVRARFNYYNAFWAWWWQVDDILLGQAGCLPGTGGLVVGNVYDGSSGAGLNGATVTNIGGGSATTFATPDPAQNDGFYILYAEAGPQDFEATKDQYSTAQGSLTVVPATAQRLDFTLESGNLTVDPTELNGRVNPGGTEEQTLEIINTGSAEAHFEIDEINAPLLTSFTHGFAPRALREQAIARLPQTAKGPEHTAYSTKDLVQPGPRPNATNRVLAAGDVISSWDTNLAFGWGVSTSASGIWLTNIAVAGGDDQDYEFSADGSQTGNTIDLTGIGQWAADGTFNSLTGMMWNVAVGGDNCIYELDPVSLQQTGNTICGAAWTGTSQRGLAFDQGGSTFFVGGWNDFTVHHIDLDGNEIDSAFTGLPISGMAYSSANGHLLLMSNQPAGQDVTVLDALNGYAELGTFQVTDGGSPVFGDFEQAGIEFDCVGNLWAVNQITQVMYQVESGETAGCEVDIPWFAVDPAEGTVAPAAGNGAVNPFPVSAQWDAGSLMPGLQQAQLSVKTDTPHQVPAIPVTLTVRFLDVPDTNIFEAYIYGVAGAGVMFGGPPVCPAGVLYFCPDGVVTRADMAGYLWRAIMGKNTPPPVYQNIFTDVTFNSYNSFYIQGIYDLGITAGCNSGTTYCPNDANTRQQMSVFIWKGEHGDEAPPACTPGVFADVPCPSLFADYIEGLYNEGVTAGCGGGNFCPTANITNGQMAVFLAKGFNIPVLLP